MRNLFLKFLAISILSITGLNAQTDKSIISDDFLDYMKLIMNRCEFGLDKSQGKFYPYSSRYGRRVAYENKVSDKSIFANGIDKKEATRRLRKNLEDIIKPLSEYLNLTYGVKSFDSLSVTQRELLIDWSYSVGMETMPKSFLETVLKSDWKTLVDNMLYVRQLEGWPDTYMNKIFGFRWINKSSKQSFKGFGN